GALAQLKQIRKANFSQFWPEMSPGVGGIQLSNGSSLGYVGIFVPAKTRSSPPSSGQFINRKLSWLEFNQRVLEEAKDTRNPLLERLKFFCIVSSNLDEFFEVRIAGVKQQIESDTVERSMDGLTATETFQALVKRIRVMVDDLYACWRESLKPQLEKNRI